MNERTPPEPRASGAAGAEARPRPEPSAEIGSRDQVEQTLDEALAESFPASDPVSIVTSQREEAWQKDAKAEEERRHRERGDSSR